MAEFLCPPIPIQDFAVFADESGVSNDRHKVVGATVVRRLYLAAPYRSIHEFRHDNKMFAELKWSKVSNQKLQKHKELVDIFLPFPKGAL